MTKTGKKINGKQKLTPSDIVVHVILVILSVIWVIPILWIVLISFRGEKGQYVSTLQKASLIRFRSRSRKQLILTEQPDGSRLLRSLFR